MFTDRDFYRSVLAGALETFDLDRLAMMLGVPNKQFRTRYVLLLSG